ncbi:hypothetical protein FJT64_005029 [Amphibalanus amphitrite]|uniref:Uncharacterized protein n=1 Tax=Amphibalanus amphitrite TaxID=1232801 RepID=A0A6A4VTP6_AMPAM|nr:hypothetical protein FJT64_005029 [Amphibalanus amphitrite]
MTISQIQRSAVGCRAPAKRSQLETDGRLAKPPSCAVVFKTTAPHETGRSPLSLNMLSRSSDESKHSYLTRASPLPVKTAVELANCRLSKKGQCGLESCFCQGSRRVDNNALKAQWLAAPTPTGGLSNSNNKSNFSRSNSGYGSLRSRSDADCGLRILGVKSEYGIRDPASKSSTASTASSSKSKESCGSDVSLGSVESSRSPRDQMWTTSKIWKDAWDISPVKDHWKDSITSWRNSALYSWRKESDADDIWKKPKATPKPTVAPGPPKSFTVTARTLQNNCDRDMVSLPLLCCLSCPHLSQRVSPILLGITSIAVEASAERYERYASGEKRQALRSGRRRHSSSPSSSSRRHRPKLNRRAKGDSYDSQLAAVAVVAEVSFGATSVYLCVGGVAAGRRRSAGAMSSRSRRVYGRSRTTALGGAMETSSGVATRRGSDAVEPSEFRSDVAYHPLVYKYAKLDRLGLESTGSKLAHWEEKYKKRQGDEDGRAPAPAQHRHSDSDLYPRLGGVRATEYKGSDTSLSAAAPEGKPPHQPKLGRSSSWKISAKELEKEPYRRFRSRFLTQTVPEGLDDRLAHAEDRPSPVTASPRLRRRLVANSPSLTRPIEPAPVQKSSSGFFGRRSSATGEKLTLKDRLLVHFSSKKKVEEPEVSKTVDALKRVEEPAVVKESKDLEEVKVGRAEEGGGR